MGRLIDADKIDFNEVYVGQSDFAKDMRRAAQSLIKAQPTAFNVEKVLEELKKESINVMLPNGFREPCVTLKTVETIVKGGGQHEIN